MTGRLAGAPRTGARILIGATLAALAWVAPALGQDLDRFSVRVDSIAVHGNQRHSATEIVDRSGLRVGNIVQGPQVQDAIRRLFASGNFSDVQVSVSGTDPEAAIFHIIVEERPTITSYEFEGLEHVSESQVRDTIGLARNAPLDPDRIARARSLIVSRLSNEGFPKATVDTSIVLDPRSPGSFRVAFRVREGPRLGLTRIEFEGNDAFDDAAIRSAMVTDEEGFFWFDAGELKRDEYRRDLADRLPQFYARHGYLDFRVLDDTVIADPATGKGRVVVRVDEGPRYLLEELRIIGNRRFPTAQIQEIVRAAQGSPEEQAGLAPVNLPALEEASADLSDLYRNEGYLDALVQPDVRRLPASEPGADPRVVAVIDIREGNPTYIREIQIEGNTYTHDRIIRNRLFIFPSDIYSQDRLVRSVQAIQGLGFFEPLPPDQAVQFRDRPDGDMDVTLRVEEKQTGTLNFGVTASGITGFAGFIGYEQPNLFGQAKSGRFRWIFGRRQQDIEVAYSDPEILGSPYSGTIALRNSRDQFTGFSLGDRRQTGGSVEFGVPVFDFRSTRLFIGYSLFDDRVRGVDTTNVIGQRASLFTGTRSSVSLRLVQDDRNNPIFPTRGSRNTISIRQTGGPLGGDGDYQKIDVSSEWFVPVAQLGGGVQSVPIEFTFGMNFESGIILGRNPFFTERYYVGGTQAGVTLRGYEEATVTPLGHIPREARLSDLDRVGESYFKAGAVFGAKFTSNIFASAFLDAGNVWGEADELNPTDLLVGAGVGVSLVTPFGPLGIDYAYGFDRRDVLGRPDPGWELHFKFGRIF